MSCTCEWLLGWRGTGVVHLCVLYDSISPNMYTPISHSHPLSYPPPTPTHTHPPPSAITYIFFPQHVSTHTSTLRLPHSHSHSHTHTHTHSPPSHILLVLTLTPTPSHILLPPGHIIPSHTSIPTQQAHTSPHCLPADAGEAVQPHEHLTFATHLDAIGRGGWREEGKRNG